MMPDRQADADAVLAYLKARANPDNIAGMARYGIATDRALGISNAELRLVARAIGRNHERALALWQSGIREACLLASYTDEKKKVTEAQARAWANDFSSWEIVDGVTDLFVAAGLAPTLIPEFAADDREFVRRAAFAMIVWLSVHDKKRMDADLLAYLPLIERYATDDRNFVRKAVNWALRTIGKRSPACHSPALSLARQLAASADKTARWIGKDAVRELESEAVAIRFAKARSA